ncbi:hypothetical protein [Dactylosporangium sp. NPDC049140]|uniref:hypothetical protein n=1 Tax=Dactylosporangium sp. NPDC049140 TaxID=3155647 RepID=UPI0033D1E32E
MNTPHSEPMPLDELKLVVLAELVIAGRPERTVGVPLEELLFDRVDADRYELCLHGLLDAVVALERR